MNWPLRKEAPVRARSGIALLLGLVLFSVCLGVWADPPRPQALWRVYLPPIMRGSALPAATPGASPSASRTPTSRATATTPGPTATATLTRTPSPSPTMAPCEAVPIPLAPANGAVLDTLCPLMRFDAGAQLNASRFDLEFSLDSRFEVVRFAATSFPARGVNQFQLHRNLDAGARFYWRVRLKCGEAVAPWSQVWSFTAGSGGTFAPAPALSSPISGTLLTSWPATLTWSAVPSALEYQVLWRKASAPGVTYSTWTDQTRATAWGLEPSTLYEWSVATRNAYGIGPSSVWWQFATPSTQPAPEDVFPVGGRFEVDEQGRVTHVRTRAGP
jgi:hypothetical protein